MLNIYFPKKSPLQQVWAIFPDCSKVDNPDSVGKLSIKMLKNCSLCGNVGIKPSYNIFIFLLLLPQNKIFIVSVQSQDCSDHSGSSGIQH